MRPQDLVSNSRLNIGPAASLGVHFVTPWLSFGSGEHLRDQRLNQTMGRNPRFGNLKEESRVGRQQGVAQIRAMVSGIVTGTAGGDAFIGATG
jgi:hypothetical protein